MHTHYQQGTKIIIVCKDGEEIIGKFQDRKSQYIHLENQKVHINKVKKIGVYKDRNPNVKESDDGES